MTQDPGEVMEKFFRCPLCKLPHEVRTTTCPITGRPVTAPVPRRKNKAPDAASVNDGAPVHDGAPGPLRGRLPHAPGRIEPGPSAAEIGPGFLLDRKYLLGAPLGEGAMGVVYEATHVLLARKVAVKLIRTGTHADSAIERAFLKEGRNLASVSHPHVVSLFDFGVAQGVQYLVMERLPGEALDMRLGRAGPLDLHTATDIAQQILSGLAAAHALGLVHRDLKPANVFLVEQEDGGAQVKLIDFGISTETAKKESEPRILGTPNYLAPEQARGEPVTTAADLYAFGATMYEMITGRPPLVSESLPKLLAAIQLDAPEPPSRYRAGLPTLLDVFLLKALAKHPKDRFSSAEEALHELQQIRASMVPKATYILVADANPLAGEVCRRAARSLGHTAIVVRDGGEALEKVRENGPPSLVVVSSSLPGMDGLTLLGKLRETLSAEEVPALIASKFPAIRSSIFQVREALGISDVLAAFTTEDEVTRAMASALAGENTGDVAALSAAPASSEVLRLRKIARMRLVNDGPPDEALQRLVAEIAEAFRVPIALVTIVLEDRQWFKSYVGLEGDVIAQRGTPREWSFCSQVAEAGERLIVPDAKMHPAFRDNPLVKRGTVGGYAGVPLETSSGEVLGTLCLVSHGPLRLSAPMLDALGALARRIAGDLELSADTLTQDGDDEVWSGPLSDLSGPVSGPAHEDLRGPASRGPATSRRSAALPHLDLHDDPSSIRGAEMVDGASDPMCAVVTLDADRRVKRASDGVRPLFGVRPEALIGLTRDEMLRTIATNLEDPSRFLRDVYVLPKGPFAAQATFEVAPLSERRADGKPLSRRLQWLARPVRARGGVEHVEVYRSLDDPPETVKARRP